MKRRSFLPMAVMVATVTSAAAAGQLGGHRKKLTAPSLAAATSATSKMAPIPISFDRFVLPNGLTVIVHEDHKTPIVAVGIWYHVGSANETPGRTGFAHLFEHLMFNGSEHANTDWFEQMNEVGGSSMNGTTEFDMTKYFEVVPKVALDRVLWLESDRMGHLLPAIDQARLDEQRKVVQNEKRQRENQPLAKMGEILLRNSYPAGHPYSWEPIGSMEDLNAADLDDVKNFFNTWYKPNNAVLVLSGDITLPEAREKVARYFGDIPAGPPLNRSKSWVAKRTGHIRVQMDVQVPNPILFRFWNVPAWGDPEIPALRIAAETLGDGQNSFLYRRLVLERHIASEVQAGVSTQELGSVFQLNATALPGVSFKELERAVDEEMTAYLRVGPSAEEVERFKRSRYGGTIRAQSSALGLAERLAQNQVLAGDAGFEAVGQARVLAVTPAEVLASARKWLTDGDLTIEARSVPDYKVSAQSVDRTVKPPIGTLSNFTLPRLQHATLTNGVKVALAERHDLPTVAMTMYFGGGALPDRSPASVGLSEGMTLTSAGTTTRSRGEIAKALQRLGGGVNWTIAQEDTRFGMSALKENLDPTLDIYTDILRNPSFPEKEWALRREQLIAAYKENSLTPTGKYKRITPKILLGPNHPYAARLTPETINRIKTADLRAFYQKWVRPDNATILIVGDTTLAEIMPKLEKRLSGWTAPATPLPVKVALPPPLRPDHPRVILVDQPGAPSSIVKVFETGGPRIDPDFEINKVVNTVVGGHFLSRLNMNLREQKGWSYGASSAIESAPLIGVIEAGGSVQADKTADAMREIQRELHEVGTTRPPTDAEIKASKNAILLGLPATLESPDGLMSFYAGSFEYGLPEDYWNGYVGRIQALTPEQIRAAARRLYRENEFTWLVVGDLSKIEADVRKLNLGTVQVLDAEGKVIR